MFQGTPPPVKALPDGLRCGGQPFTGPLPKRFEIGAEGGLADVVVYVTAGPSIDQKAFVVPPAPVVVKISNCLYHPYVFGVRVGQSIRFHNGGSDPEVIRIPSASGGGVRELQRLLRPDQTVDIVLTQPAAHRRIQSETDRWRVAYVSAFEHPWFSVTDTNGNYWLPALAPGEHWICAQHREKKLLQVVKIDPQQSPQVLDFAFGEGAAPQETSIKNPAE